jgi:hypothetical protein
MTDPRDLIKRLANDLEGITEELVIPEYAHTQKERTDASLALADEARAYLAQPEPEEPTDEEIMRLMPQQMHEDLAAAARALAEQASAISTSATGIMRIMLNRHAVDLAQAVPTRWGRPAAEPEGTITEPRGCPTPGACSCPTAPFVPPELIRALELAEAALADIGDAEREPGDDLAWAESRAAQDLPRIRAVLARWGGPTQHGCTQLP